MSYFLFGTPPVRTYEEEGVEQALNPLDCNAVNESNSNLIGMQRTKHTSLGAVTGVCVGEVGCTYVLGTDPFRTLFYNEQSNVEIGSGMKCDVLRTFDDTFFPFLLPRRICPPLRQMTEAISALAEQRGSSDSIRSSI